MKIYLLFLVFIFLFSFKNSFGAEFEEIMLSEINWKGEEWIELRNLGGNEVNLAGWKIENAKAKKQPLSFPEDFNLILPPKGYFLICDLQTPFAFCDFKTSISLNDNYPENGELILKDKSGKAIDQTPPPQSSKWPAGGEGISMERKFENGKPLPGKDQNSWQENPSPSPQGSGIFEANAGPDIVTFSNLPVVFNALASKGQIEKYFWNFGDGNFKEGKTTLHSYQFSGKYLVSLKVTGQGKEDEDLIQVQVFPKEIFISEFDPNQKWIEIVNEGENIEDISGFEVSTKKELGSGFVFPEGSFINKKSYLLLSSKVLSKISFPKEGSLYLLLPSGDIKQEIKYKAGQGTIVKKGNDYFYSKVSTPGKPNVVSFSSQGAGSTLPKNVKEVKLPLFPKKVLGEFFAQSPRNLFLAGSAVALFAGLYSLALIKLRRKTKRKEKLQIEIEEINE